jgi:hypothetical protein
MFAHVKRELVIKCCQKGLRCFFQIYVLVIKITAPYLFVETENIISGVPGASAERVKLL